LRSEDRHFRQKSTVQFKSVVTFAVLDSAVLANADGNANAGLTCDSGCWCIRSCWMSDKACAKKRRGYFLDSDSHSTAALIKADMRQHRLTKWYQS